MATKQDVLSFISAQGYASGGVENDILIKYVEATDASNEYAQAIISAFNAFLAPAPVVEEVVADVAPVKASKSE